MTSRGSTDVFAVRLLDTGTAGFLYWFLTQGGSGAEHATALALAGSALVLAGTFASAVFPFGGLAPGTTPATLANTGTMAPLPATLFVEKVVQTPNLDIVWATRAGGLTNTQPAALALAGNRIWVGGSAAPTATFGSLQPLTGVGNPAGLSGFAGRFDPGPPRPGRRPRRPRAVPQPGPRNSDPDRPAGPRRVPHRHALQRAGPGGAGGGTGTRGRCRYLVGGRLASGRCMPCKWRGAGLTTTRRVVVE